MMPFMGEQSAFDVIVLGGGPGGYPAAIRAAQWGRSVALIECDSLGGTCLNRGCIPTKALIANADVLKRVQSADAFGIKVGAISIDFSVMNQRKDKVVAKMLQGLEGLIASHAITLFRGRGKFTGLHEIKVMGQDSAILTGQSIIIATGSEPRRLSAFPFDGEFIHNSTSILNLKTLPKSLVIVGGGIIGCEFASLYQALGVKVIVLEALPSLLPMQSKQIIQAITAAFKKQGIEVHTGVSVKAITRTPKGIHVSLTEGDPIDADLALVAVGRSRNTQDIGLEKAGVVTTESGEIPTNAQMETNVPGIYAVGDVTGNWWLAHVASHQGLVAADNACGHPATMHYNAVPAVTFTDPEIATVGITLEEAQKAGYDAKIGAYPFAALGKSQAAGHPEGFAQIVIDQHTGQILGAQVVGYEAGTLIAAMGLAIANELTVECLMETIHAHPTIAEAWLEAALVANDTPLHFPPKRPRDSHA
jgi:dihydrolipoamide dehydrogenase